MTEQAARSGVGGHLTQAGTQVGIFLELKSLVVHSVLVPSGTSAVPGTW